MIKKDILVRADIQTLLEYFYNRLLLDEEMSVFFEKFKDPITLEYHLQILVDFWDNVLFYSGTYSKNAMLPHIELNKKIPFLKIHFDLWLSYFNLAVDDNFKGNNAEIIKNRANSIATVMKLKILKY